MTGYKILIVMSDRINNFEKLPVQLKNKLECIWKLLGDVLRSVKSVLGPFCSFLGPIWDRSVQILGTFEGFWDLRNWCWALLKFFSAFQSDVGSIAE